VPSGHFVTDRDAAFAGDIDFDGDNLAGVIALIFEEQGQCFMLALQVVAQFGAETPDDLFDLVFFLTVLHADLVVAVS